MPQAERVASASRPQQPVGWEVGWLIPPETSSAMPRGGLTIKFGGSLLARPDWPELLESLVSAVDRPLCLVVGGGPVVEGLRTLDAVRRQPAERMHRLAIRGMGITARLVAGTLGVPLLPDPRAAATNSGVVDADTWLEKGLLADLPADWSVTSDSIAAAVAATNRQPLLLAKSVSPPGHGVPPPGHGASPSCQPLADLGDWVDPHFTRVAVRLPSIRWAAPRASSTA